MKIAVMVLLFICTCLCACAQEQKPVPVAAKTPAPSPTPAPPATAEPPKEPPKQPTPPGPPPPQSFSKLEQIVASDIAQKQQDLQVEIDDFMGEVKRNHPGYEFMNGSLVPVPPAPVKAPPKKP